MATWQRVAAALDNERAIDLRYRATRTSLPVGGPVPNFKVMQQLALQAQLGSLYPLAIALMRVAVLLAAPLQWLLLAIGAAWARKRSSTDAWRILATTPDNRALINAALDADPEAAARARRPLVLGLYALGGEIGWRGWAETVAAHLRLLAHLLGRPNSERRDLMLHARDALGLLALARLASSGSGFVTDDHYQRWAHLLSHGARDFRIVQHGFLDDHLALPHAGGRVAVLYLRDTLFRPSFERFYAIAEHRTFAPPARFVKTPLSGRAVLLASSFPSIDDEIALLDAIRARADVPVIIKFHPAHRYDARRTKLAARSTLVYDGPGNPACRVFVSHGSFMEFDYRGHGVPSVSITRCGSVDAACREILTLLEHLDDQSAARTPPDTALYGQ
jgi:hypothetical protein